MNIIQLISMIEKRPGLYIGQNYISCLKAYLDGWGDAVNKDQSKIFYEFNSDFHDFIISRYKITGSHSWCDILLFYSSDEYNALNTFFREFNDFLKEHPKYLLMSDK